LQIRLIFIALAKTTLAIQPNHPDQAFNFAPVISA
jgi:hypothetical protein